MLCLCTAMRAGSWVKQHFNFNASVVKRTKRGFAECRSDGKITHQLESQTAWPYDFGLLGGRVEQYLCSLCMNHWRRHKEILNPGCTQVQRLQFQLKALQFPSSVIGKHNLKLSPSILNAWVVTKRLEHTAVTVNWNYFIFVLKRNGPWPLKLYPASPLS